MMYTIALSLILACLTSISATLTGAQIKQDLQSVLSAQSTIYLPIDGVFANDTTQRYNTWNAPTYVVSVKPALTKDVQKVVTYATRNNVSFLTTGAAHGYSGSLITLQNGIELDMSNFNSVSVDVSKNQMTVGGSVKFSDIMNQVYSAGKSIPVGACSCVGVAGATLGGGIGFYSGIYGAISDSLLSVEIVIPNGELVVASNYKNSDLFWALKGAGSNFGVVTLLTFQVYDSPNAGMVMNADMIFPVSLNATLWNFAKTFLGRQPKELSMGFSVTFDPASQQVAILTNVIYVGPLAKGKSIIQPLLDLNPLNLNISYVPWKDIPDTADYGLVGQNCALTSLNFIPYSLNIYKIDVPGMIAAINFVSNALKTTPALQTTLISFVQYAQHGFQIHAGDNSAYPHREVVWFAQIDGIAFREADVPAIDSFGRILRDKLQKISGKDELQVYTHFAHGDEGAAAWYSRANVPRLRELKRSYDPKSMFSFYNPVNRN